MRSSSYFVPSQPKKGDAFILGPVLYPDGMDDDTSGSSRRMNKSHSSRPSTDSGSLIFRSPSPSDSTRKSKKSKGRKEIKPWKASKRSKKGRRDEYSNEDCRRDERDEEYARKESDKDKRRKMIELAKRAEQDHDKLMMQRSLAQQTTKEIESSMSMEQDSRNRSMAMMEKQVEGMDWRTSRDLKDVKREIAQWKKKTVMTGELVKRVDTIEKRVDAMEKTEVERKKTIDMVEKNWGDFNRLKTQMMALEITQIKNRRGDMHLSRMPKDVAETTAKNLYKLCSDLNRLRFHLTPKGELPRLVEEALILAEAIAPLYGPKVEEAEESTSLTNVSLSNHKSAESPSTPAPVVSPGAPIRETLSRMGRDPASIEIPPLSKFDNKYAKKENLHIDGPSLREKCPDYYSDEEFAKLSMEINTDANAKKGSKESTPAKTVSTASVVLSTPPPVTATTPVPPIVTNTAPDTPAAAPSVPAAPAAVVPDASSPAAATPAAPVPPSEPSPASVSLSVDSDKDALMRQMEEAKKQKEKKRSRGSAKEGKAETEDAK